MQQCEFKNYINAWDYKIKEKQMQRNILLMLGMVIILLAAMPFVIAQSTEVGEGGSGTVAPSTASTRASKPDQKIINEAEDFLKKKLGDSYYAQFITVTSKESFKDCDKTSCTIRNEITFSYKIPFSTEGVDPHFSSQPDSIQITLDSNGVVQNYLGPKKPYQFLVDAEQAKAKAKTYGLQKITGSVLNTAAITADGYELVWAVSSDDEIARGSVMNEPIYRGVYVDIDSGEIRGEYRINPLIEVPGGSSGGAQLGNFFAEDNGDPEPQPQQKATKRSSALLWILIGVVAVSMLIFGIAYKKSRK
ncbi:MAG: hypothetical protein AABW64_04865 [Nanoarchaeota archaeon]